MKRSFRLFFTLAIILSCFRAYALTTPSETWMGAYMGQKKIGYLSYKVEKSDANDGSAYKVSSVMSTRMTVLGADLTQLVSTVVYTDDKFAPLKEMFSMSSGGKTTTVNAVFKPTVVECDISAGSGASKQSVPIPNGVNLIGDAMFTAPGVKMEVGKKYTEYYFNPLTISIDPMTLTVESREKITVGGKEYDTMVVNNSTSMGDMTIWQTDDGDVIQIKAVMGITMLREDKTKAVEGVQSGGGEDFAELTSLKPDKKIESPRQVTFLDIILKGIADRKMMINDKRQVVTRVKDQDDWVRFKISASRFRSAKSIKRPVKSAAYKDLLAPTPYIDSDVKAIKDQAAKIVGDENNAYKAATALRNWVYLNMKPKADIGITRSASDVLQSRVGVCRDYGILLAALCRASGIPAKIAAGTLYTNGAFYYHVWVECYVGEWVPLDATLSQDFVDATHIKIAEGDATTMFGLSKVIGTLTGEVKSYK